jgi:hypothetical protein
MIAAATEGAVLFSAVVVWSHPTVICKILIAAPGSFSVRQRLDCHIFGMKLISKIAVVAAGFVTAIWTISYWDAREPDVACDIGQAPSHVCQGGFVKASRFKHLLESNERN